MADQRQSSRNGFSYIPGSITAETSFTETPPPTSSVTVNAASRFIPPPVALQRDPPAYNEVVSSSRAVAVLDNDNEYGEGAIAQVESVESPEYSDKDPDLTSDEYVIQGYEHVTYEPSKWNFYFS